MSRTFYSDYVRHCMTFYARFEQPTFCTDIDKENWLACDNALKRFSIEDRKVLLEIYRDSSTLSDSIYEACNTLGITKDRVWKLINDLERKVALERKLI